jgi:predicted  nucleic acid-binding Zn-ribbon protein
MHTVDAYQNEQLDGWINAKEVWLQTQQEESKNLIDQIKSSEASHTLKVNELTQQANDDLKDFRENTLLQVQGFQDEIVTKIDNKLQKLSDIENRITGFINNSMRNATNQLKTDINERLNQLEQSQTQFLDHQRALVDQLIQRQNLIEQSTPGFRDNLSQLSNDINVLKDQQIQSLLVRIEALEEKTKTKRWFGKG